MALIDEVLARYGADHFTSLSNPNDPDAANTSGQDTARITLACDDVEALFKTEAQVEFDITFRPHLVHAVEGVEKLLMKRLGQIGAAAEYEEWKRGFESIKKTGPRQRVTLGSNSLLTITDPGQNGDTVRPWSEDASFRRQIPDAPNQGDPNYQTRDDF